MIYLIVIIEIDHSQAFYAAYTKADRKINVSYVKKAWQALCEAENNTLLLPQLTLEDFMRRTAAERRGREANATFSKSLGICAYFKDF